MAGPPAPPLVYHEMVNLGMHSEWVHDGNAALLTDLYELTMLQSYFDSGMAAEAVFDLFIRRLPHKRNYLVAGGLEDALHYLETACFDVESVSYLKSLNLFSAGFLDSLRAFRFTGDVFAVPEGTIVFANEPILEVIAPLPEAQLVETFLLNQIHWQTLAASKASRVVTAAQGRTVVDFGLRRMHGLDAGVKAARAFYIAGVEATSNVLAGRIYGIPVAGTMAHSYVQASDSEMESFRNFVRTYPSTSLIVDTYDTLEGVRHVVQLARELGGDFRVRGIRLDSGDLAALSREARQILDDGGLNRLEIFASSGLDEYAIEKLIADGAPITGFGVGAKMGVSADSPYLDSAYKLVEYAGEPRIKLSVGKITLPGRKQVFRQQGHDIIALAGERRDGEPLLVQVMSGGRRLNAGQTSVEDARRRCAQQLQVLPPRLRGLTTVEPYAVEWSAELRALQEHCRRGR